jgi:hypothetical protein
MAKASNKGIPLGNYIKDYEQPEPFVRNQLDREELRYTWKDNNGNLRASDDGRPLPPKGWWTRPELTVIDFELHSVRGDAFIPPFFPPMFFVKVFPVVAAERLTQKAPRRGRPSSAPLVLEEATRQLQGSDRETYIRQGRKNFLERLSNWLRDTHAKARPMAPKTIGDHLRENVNVRALLPESWFRQK